MNTRIYTATICLSICLSMTACGKARNQIVDVTPVTEISPESTVTMESETEAPAETTAEEQAGEDLPISLDEYAFCDDETANETYRTFFREEEYIPDFNRILDDYKYELAYVDDDDYPEIILCNGVSHSCPFYLYRYNAADNCLELVGAFSQEGHFAYRERGSIVISVYGSTGCYTTYLSRIDGTQVSLAGIAAYMTKQADGTYYYYLDFPPANDSNGKYHDISEDDWPDDAYQVSEEAYHARFDEIYDEDTYAVYYKDMKNVDLFY